MDKNAAQLEPIERALERRRDVVAFKAHLAAEYG
jgi:hypothetical protein